MYLSTGFHRGCERALCSFYLKQYQALHTSSFNKLNQFQRYQVKPMQARWIHSSGIKQQKKGAVHGSQTKSKVTDDDDTEIRLDHMEKLIHFRDSIKPQKPPPKTEPIEENTSTSDVAGIDTNVHPDVLEARSMQDGGYRLPHPIWTDDEVSSVQITHRLPVTKVDKLAYYTVKCMRSAFDILSGYTLGNWTGRLDEKQWIKRIIFLETVAGVPGMVGAMVRHLISLRRFKRDQGWIHTLLEEAENERMHLMTAMRVGNPGIIMRSFVFTTQAVFVGGFSLAYLISPRFCHRFVGYLEEEAVKTYTLCLKEIDGGRLKMWCRMKAPEIAVEYWKLPPDAMMRDVILAIRADEAHHRAVNHTLSAMKPDEQNPFPPGE